MNLSRQEKAFTYFVSETVKLLKHDGKEQAAEELKEIFGYPGIADALQQAFSNVLWKEDDRNEKAQAEELAMNIKVISQIADPENENTQKIIQFLQQAVQEADEEMETLSDAEINELVGDEEEDNTPIPL